jgi:pimeloyl-ACP methyl ester carboxylesterase
MHDLPVAVLVGSADRLTPRSCAETIADALPRAEYTMCDGAGHMLPIERPDAVSSAIARICATVDAQPAKRSWFRRRRTAPRQRPAEAA